MWFEYYQSGRTGKWYWRLKTNNHRVVADGAQGYASKKGVKRAINRLRDGAWDLMNKLECPAIDVTIK